MGGLDYQPLFGKGARAPPPSLPGEGRPDLDTRERRKSSLMSRYGTVPYIRLDSLRVYRCFDKGCPKRKMYATLPIGIVGSNRF